MHRNVRHRLNPQDKIAHLMEYAPEYGENPSEIETVPEGAEETTVRSCSASKCRHNSDGSRCTLDIINISDTGGCTEYEAVADDFEHEDDEATIAGISSMIPDDPSAHPSSVANMTGKFLPDAIR